MAGIVMDDPNDMRGSYGPKKQGPVKPQRFGVMGEPGDEKGVKVARDAGVGLHKPGMLAKLKSGGYKR